MTRALITGITGQDGSYLAEFLHARDYEVFGLVRGDDAAEQLRERLPFAEPLRGDLGDLASLETALAESQPTEVYNLGAYSSVSRSWEQAERAADITGVGALRLLDAVRRSGRSDEIRIYQASSSEMYGEATTSPQDEATPFAPVHPYAVAKVFAHQIVLTYRRAYGIFAVGGILFNHESPRRGPDFVTRKISRGVARVRLGLQDHLTLGTLEVRRDWGYAPEYVEAMWLMMQQEEAEDYVIATGVTHSVRDFVEAAFLHAGIPDWEPLVEIDPGLQRPTDIAELRGNPAKARDRLGWTAATAFEELVGIMVDADLAREQARTAPATTGGERRGE
ncbi:MAG: GDP-mannose 4,6-dehydratase [Actinomycetota bacterium]